MSDWNEEQAAGKAAMRMRGKEREQAQRLVEALRTSGLTADDCRAVETIHIPPDAVVLDSRL